MAAYDVRLQANDRLLSGGMRDDNDRHILQCGNISPWPEGKNDAQRPLLKLKANSHVGCGNAGFDPSRTVAANFAAKHPFQIRNMHTAMLPQTRNDERGSAMQRPVCSEKEGH